MWGVGWSPCGAQSHLAWLKVSCSWEGTGLNDLLKGPFQPKTIQWFHELQYFLVQLILKNSGCTSGKISQAWLHEEDRALCVIPQKKYRRENHSCFNPCSLTNIFDYFQYCCKAVSWDPSGKWWRMPHCAGSHLPRGAFSDGDFTRNGETRGPAASPGLASPLWATCKAAHSAGEKKKNNPKFPLRNLNLFIQLLRKKILEMPHNTALFSYLCPRAMH